MRARYRCNKSLDMQMLDQKKYLKFLERSDQSPLKKSF